MALPDNERQARIDRIVELKRNGQADGLHGLGLLDWLKNQLQPIPAPIQNLPQEPLDQVHAREGA